MSKHKKKRVLYLHASAELYGSDLILYQLVTHIDRTIYEPVVVLPFYGPLVSLLEKDKIPVYVHKLPILRRSLLNTKGLIEFGAVMFDAIVFLSSFIRSQGINIVHTNTSATWGGGIAARLCRIPHVCSAMELVDDPLYVAKAMALMAVSFSDVIFTVSSAVKNHFTHLVPYCEDKYEVLFPPVDTKRFCFNKEHRRKIRKQLGIDNNTIIAGMAGRLNHWKGQDVFVRACKIAVEKLGSSVSGVKFLVLGGPVPGREFFEERLHDDIKYLGLSDIVIAPGFQENIEEWMSAMDIFVLPSKWPEPSSTGVVAAMAVGLPVIGTNIGGTPETVVHGETGLLVPPDDPDALANAMVKLITDEKLRRDMSRNARKRAIELYSIEAYVRYIMKCYDNLLQVS